MANNAWGKFKKRNPKKYGQLRDVYEDQDFSGGDLPQIQTMTSRLIICIIGAVFVSFLFYAAWCFVATSTERSALQKSSSADNGYVEEGPASDDGSASSGDYEYGSDAFREYYAKKNAEAASEGGADGSSSDSNEKEPGEYEYSSSLFREYYGIEGDAPGATYEDADGSGFSDDTVSDAGNENGSFGVSDYEENADNADFHAEDASGSDKEDAGHDADESEIAAASVGRAASKMIDWRPRSFTHVFMSIVVGLGFFMFLYEYMKRNLQAQNMLADMSDLNQYKNDQHIALPQEVMEKFDYFPDVGAHCSVSPSSMISHIMLQNKGINCVDMPVRCKKDVIDSDTHDVVYHKGEIICNEDGDAEEYENVPMFDEIFAAELYKASGMPKDVRKSFDVRNVLYNPGGENRDKLKYETVADLINGDWFIPDYEPQRPAGAYLVDTAPVNTMIIAMTRAGKGQTYIEPMIDMWLRELRANNIVVNDPKGELLVKFYVRAAVRGYEVIQLNLINAMKTNICNPLTLASQCARQGDFTNCAMYVENIATVFFPVDGGEEPMWPNAANNAFKRAVYGMIDYYLEEEKEYRNECNRRIMNGEFIDPQTIETYVDELWGRVTLYNCYQLFVQLSSKKLKNPVVEVSSKIKSGFYEREGMLKGMSAEEIEEWKQSESSEAEMKSVLWNGSPEADCLTLYFAATKKLPRNSIRNLLNNADDSLKAMGGAEKMISSVYGIAITAMAFFTDPTIAAMTSGRPSQSVDFGGFSFPRRIGVQFHPDYVADKHYVGLRCQWSAYEDDGFKKKLGKEFCHSDIVSREGWACSYFDGKFEKDRAYIKLELRNEETGYLVHTYYFEFKKKYETSLNGRTYVTDPVLKTKIVRDGTLRELLKDKKTGKFSYGTSVFKRKSLYLDEDGAAEVVTETIPAITQNLVKYSEKPKILFMVTPPHLMKYAKLILIIIKQLVDINFASSYLTKENQKPLYKTRYMLDNVLTNQG